MYCVVDMECDPAPCEMDEEQPQGDKRTLTTVQGSQHAQPEVAIIQSAPTDGAVGLGRSLNNPVPCKPWHHTYHSRSIDS